MATENDDSQSMNGILSNISRDVVDTSWDIPPLTFPKLQPTDSEEADGADDVLDVLGIRGGKLRRTGIFAEQFRRDHVHARVGALRRQTHGEQQLIVLLIVQRTQRVRVQRLQRRDNGTDLFLRLHATSPHPNCNRGCRKRQSVLYCFIRFSTEGRRCRYASAGRRDTAPDS